MLLPGADHDTQGFAARLDRLERRASIAPAAEPPAAPPRSTPARAEPAPGSVDPGPVAAPAPTPVAGPAATTGETPVARPAPPEPAAPAPGALSLADVRRIWPDLLEQVKAMRRFTWILLSQNAQVIGVDATTLTVGFKTAGARDSFVGGGSEEILRQAAIDMIGTDWTVETAVDPSAQPGQETAPRVTRPAVADPAPPTAAAPSAPPAWASDEAPPATPPEPVRPESVAAARSGIAPTRAAGAPAPAAPGPDPDADADRDDPVADDQGLEGAELLAARARGHRDRRHPARLAPDPARRTHPRPTGAHDDPAGPRQPLRRPRWRRGLRPRRDARAGPADAGPARRRAGGAGPRDGRGLRGWGWSVTLTGTGELTAVTVATGSFDGGDAESLSDLGDLVVAAYRDAKARVDALAADALGPLAGLGGGGGGLGGPGGLRRLGGPAGF